MTVDRQITLIGAGLIGRSWALLFARAGMRVALYDRDPTALDVARNWIAEQDREGGAWVRGRVTFTTDLSTAIGQAIHLQENLPEKIDLKAEVYRQIGDLIPQDATFASSTSALEPDRLFADVAFRERALVAHPTNPPHLLPAVELVGSSWTTPEAVAQTRRLMTDCGQDPLVLKRSVPGFIVNRLQAALISEALSLVAQDVAEPDDIDKAVRSALGMRWAFIGPFETMDLNSAGGFEQYVLAFRGMFEGLRLDMARNAGDPWSAEVTARIAQVRRRVLPIEHLAARQDWRDQRVGDLARQKQLAAHEINGEQND